MTAVDDSVYQQTLAASPIAPKYSAVLDRDSAHEILKRKIESAEAAEVESKPVSFRKPEPIDVVPRTARRTRQPKGIVEEVLGSRMAQNVARQATRTVTQSIVRGIFGMLKGR